MREYCRHGCSEKYYKLRKQYDAKLKAEKQKYLEKIKLEVTTGSRGSSYPAMKKLNLRPGDETQTGFQLPAHAEQNLSPSQSAEIIAQYFCRISQSFLPLSISNITPNV